MIIANLRYMGTTNATKDKKPVYQATVGGVADDFERGVALETRSVDIANARLLDPHPTLDKQGFRLVTHQTGIADFYDLKNRQVAYERELVDLIRTETGAGDALAFDHTLRSDSAEIRGHHTTREPADFIHNDYTDNSARKRLLDILPPDEAQQRLQHRVAIINVWRSINGTVWNSPITCCDAATIAPADRVAVERRARDRIGEVEFVTWSAAHRWYYYPEMTTGEALLIKTYDSATDGRATRSIHTAFDNPLAAESSPPRESIESRLFVFFD